MARKSYDFIIHTAETDKGLSIKDTILFHAFNPRGVVKHQRQIDDAVRAMVEAGIAKSGALMAYGSLDHTYHDMLMDMLDRKSLPTRNQLRSLIDCYADRNTKAHQWVGENGGAVACVIVEPLAEIQARREALVRELAGE